MGDLLPGKINKENCSISLQNLPVPSLLKVLQFCICSQGDGRGPNLEAETLHAGGSRSLRRKSQVYFLYVASLV